MSATEQNRANMGEESKAQKQNENDSTVLEQASSVELEHVKGEIEGGQGPEVETEEEEEGQGFRVKVISPNKSAIYLKLTGAEMISEIKQAVFQYPDTMEYSCFDLECSGKKLLESLTFAEAMQIVEQKIISEGEGKTVENGVKDEEGNVVLGISEKDYNEREVRIQLTRLRDIIGGANVTNEGMVAIDSGYTLFPVLNDKINDIISTSENGNRKKDEGAGGKKKKKHGQTQFRSIGGKKQSFGKANGVGSDNFSSGKGKKKGSTVTTAGEGAGKEDQDLIKERARAVNRILGLNDYKPGKEPSLKVLGTQEYRERLQTAACVREIIISGWNPVPRNRVQKGDIMYLELTTLEGEKYYITAHRKGFFVNKSSQREFNPEPLAQNGEKQSSTLIGLIKKLSSAFIRKFDEVQQKIARLVPLETISAGYSYLPTASWVVSGPAYSTNSGDGSAGKGEASKSTNATIGYDIGRTQSTMLKYGYRGSEAIRDWNEELQSIKELSEANEASIQSTQLLNWQNEFNEAAVSGAMAILEDDVMPLNIGMASADEKEEGEEAGGVSTEDDPEQYIYLRENIFFSKANDSRDLFSTIGGKEAAYIAASKDVEGVKLINGITENNSLYTLGTAVIDYRGERVVAQTIVPGILKRNDNSGDDAGDSIISYGSVAGGMKIQSNPEFHKLLEPVANQLKLKPRTIMDGEGTIHELYTSIDVKGIKGTDGRNYLVDCYRLFPVDSEFYKQHCVEEKNAGDENSYPHHLVLLRYELLSSYWDHCVQAQVKDILTQQEKSEDQAESKQVEDSDREKELLSKILLNQDCYVDIKTTELNEEFNRKVFDADKPVVDLVSQYLNNEVIPKFVDEISERAPSSDAAAKTTETAATNLMTPIDGKSLTKYMHNRGINMRYLGKVATLLLPTLSENTNINAGIFGLVVREMVVRAIKKLLQACFKNEPDYTEHADIFCKFVNILFNSTSQQPQVQAEALQLLNEIASQVYKRFRFDLNSLGSDWNEKFVLSHKRIMLREICLKLGVQLSLSTIIAALDDATNNDAENQEQQVSNDFKVYVSADDVLNFVPIVKHANFPINFPHEKVEFAKNLIFNSINAAPSESNAENAESSEEMALKEQQQQQQRTLGLSLIHDLCVMHETRYGHLHPLTGKFYADLSSIYHEISNLDVAIELMQQAIVTSEKSLGNDDAETIYNYLNYALYLHESSILAAAAREDAEAAEKTKSGSTQTSTPAASIDPAILSASAVVFATHALELWSLIGTLNYPVLAIIYSNIAAIYQQIYSLTARYSSIPLTSNNQSLKYLNSAISFFNLAYKLRLDIYGDSHLLTASSLLNLAKSVAATGDFKAAMNHAKSAHTIYSSLLPESDLRVKESELWLNRLTALAVESAKFAKLSSAANVPLASIPASSSETPVSLSSNKNTSTPGKKSSTNTAPLSSDKMTIDDIYNFVVGKGSSPSNRKKTNKKKRSK
ncbi:Clustered mitochondria protein-like protein [Zancudomyces culisetae]|uniref:Clustered mitochondria protein-like protein n=1 Tax=Zancudomyces culisetae TaxID=1213189 RepID=A0A1R1PVJ1_ZANCU|nr:Clustered mitochondria protein-like protein [Zancudomyces culisetae]|eukprot:OMH84968.1 Clustered mitochondria protein-like protein [Zancudomyces culisetae]